MLRLMTFICMLTMGFSCGTIKVDPMTASAESGDFSLILANGEFATDGYLFYRIRANKSVEEYFEIIPPPFKGEILIRAIGCGDREFHVSSSGKMDPLKVEFKNLVPFDQWENKSICEFYISGVFPVTVNKETKTQIANGIVKVIVFDESYEPLSLKSPYAVFTGSYKSKVSKRKQEVVYSTKLRSAIGVPNEASGEK